MGGTGASSCSLELQKQPLQLARTPSQHAPARPAVPRSLQDTVRRSAPLGWTVLPPICRALLESEGEKVAFAMSCLGGDGYVYEAVVRVGLLAGVLNRAPSPRFAKP